MKTLTTVSCAVIVLTLSGAEVWAAETVAPAGLLVPAVAATLLPSTHPAVDQLSSSQFVTEPNQKWRRRWGISLAPLFASEALDAASSYGMRELNPLLASPEGSFGMRATSLKFGVIGALAGAEYLWIKRHPHSSKALTVLNWATAAATTGLAVHNYRLH